MAVLDIVEEQEALITRMLKSGVPVRMRIDVLNEFTNGACSSSNIVGEIVGSRHPEEIVLLGAHLDSWDLGTGSIDDGFGVGAVLGAAQSIVASGIRPERTIRFALFTGEEQGLLGSRAYTRAHQEELKNFVCAFILDWGSGPITKFPLQAIPNSQRLSKNSPVPSPMLQPSRSPMAISPTRTPTHLRLPAYPP